MCRLPCNSPQCVAKMFGLFLACRYVLGGGGGVARAFVAVTGKVLLRF